MDTEEKGMEQFHLEGTDYTTRLTGKFKNRKPYQPDNPNLITAQIPGTILKVMVHEGQLVNPSKCLFILEAMKMKNKVYATISGRIKKIHIDEGQTVTKNQLLVELGEPESILKKLLTNTQARESRAEKKEKPAKPAKDKTKKEKKERPKRKG